MFKDVPKSYKQQIIAKEFGSLLVIGENKTGYVRSETHMNFVFCKVVNTAVQRARVLTGGKAIDPFLLIESLAVGHHGDRDQHLHEESSPYADGWKEKRTKALQGLSVWRGWPPGMEGHT